MLHVYICKHFGVLHLVDNEGGEDLHLTLRWGRIGGNKMHEYLGIQFNLCQQADLSK
jgi:hypothetical protein